MLLSPPLRVFTTTTTTSTIITNYETCIELFAHRLQQCARSSNLLLGSTFHAHLLKLSLLSSSLFLQNHLLNMYSKSSPSPSLPLQLFGQMPQRNLVTWSVLISGLIQHHHQPTTALSFFSSMHSSGLRPNEFTFVSALHAGSNIRNPSCARHLFAYVLKLGYDSNVFLTNAFLMGLLRNRRLAEAEELFESCRNKDVVSWNSMMTGYLELDCFKVWRFWRRMMRVGVCSPNEFSFSCVLTGLASGSASLCSGQQVHGLLVKSGFGDDKCAGNSLVDVYLKNHDLVSGFKVFEEMVDRDVVSWTLMATGCVDCGQPLKAIEIINRMKLEGTIPNKFTLATAFNACSSLASLEEGKKTHGFRVKLGDEVDACVDNALVDMYAKCGSMENAVKAFRAMKDKCTISWTTLIQGFAQNGLAREALQAFDEMISDGVKPNNVTFICVLYACSQGGLADAGRRLFTSMKSEYGISPEEDHYSCMVDLLGKAGWTKEAEALILSMPFEPGVMVWQTLLGACRIHGDLETGKRAAERALAIERTDPSTYLLLSNMFADNKVWEGVDKVRELLEDREVIKVPGSSWIEISKGKFAV